MSYAGGATAEVDNGSTVETASENKSAEIVIEELILEHRENGRKLARSLLRRWRARMNIEEIDSIVDLTLCEAATRFDPKHGASFMTFFFYHLRGHLVRAVATAVNSSNIVLASSQRPGLDVTEWFPMGEDQLKSFLPECASFGFHEVEGPENILLKKEGVDACKAACMKLDELEREVILRSFENEEPLVDIAKSLGYSRCHISRVKKRALERLAEIMTGKDEEATQTGISHREAAAQRATQKKRGRKRRSLDRLKKAA